jgi:2-iminobutanoate/2-iminopropanoate deaminase
LYVSEVRDAAGSWLAAREKSNGWIAMSEKFEKKHYSYSEWARPMFSEAVTLAGPGKLIFLAGIGAEDENGAAGTIRHLGDVTGQCRYAFDKAKRILAKHGATMNDVVKIVAYLTDVRDRAHYGKCREEALAGVEALPAHTFLTVSNLAWPGMLMEIDITAAVPR